MKKLQASSKPLTPRMQQVVELVFSPEKLTQVQIGQRLGISTSRVKQILHCKRVLDAFPIIARRYKQSLIPYAIRAQQEVIEQTRDLTVKDKASARLLESEGIWDKQPDVQVNLYANLSTKDLIESVKASIQIPDNVIDAEIIDGK